MTRTLAVAAVDIIHFGVVFMLVFVIHSIMGMILFGEELVEFANFGRAFTNTFRSLLGDPGGQETMPDDEYPMARSGRLEAALWLWSWLARRTLAPEADEAIDGTLPGAMLLRRGAPGRATDEEPKAVVAP